MNRSLILVAIAAAVAVLLPMSAVAADSARCESGQESSEATDSSASELVSAAVEAGQLAAARRHAADAAASAAAEPEPGVRVASMLEAGRAYATLARLDPDGAAAARLQASELLRRALDQSRPLADPRLESYALGELAGVYEDAGQLEQARQLANRASLRAQRADAPDALYRWQWQIGRIETALGHRERAIAAYRQSVRALAEIREFLATAGARRAAVFRSSVEPVYMGLVDLLLQQAGAMPAASRTPLLAEARDHLEAFRSAELRDYFRDECLEAQPVTTADAIAGAAVIYPIPLPDRLELLVSVEGRLTQVRVPVARDRIEPEIRALRKLLTVRTSRRYLRPASALYDWLVRPLGSLRGADGQPLTLVFVPGGALRTIPFAVLYDTTLRQHLIETHPVAVIPARGLTAPAAIDRERVSVLAAGISESVREFSPLGSVPLELAALTERFPTTGMLNAEFEAERFESALRDTPYGIVHVASHAEFSADPKQSFVLAWDRNVRLDDLSTIVSRTRFRGEQPLELLTLSACETAAGDDLAALGLAGAALRAGARSALATLWSVDDAAAAALIGEFYGALSEAGTSRAAALQHAQQHVLARRDYRHPFYWAAFVLFNSWL